MKAAIFPNTVNVHLFYKGCTLPFDNNVDLRKGSCENEPARQVGEFV